MAEKPTSSSTTYTTLAAPSGALAGSNGDQSGTESRMSTLILPLNGSLMMGSLRSASMRRAAAHAGRRYRPSPVRPPRASPQSDDPTEGRTTNAAKLLPSSSLGCYRLQEQGTG